ncbi:MAG: helix-turn-helix transcriptional regulator [Myxococcales bacterium]|nr:helix-turn-helix transcriptional regulator [Myxococcales bacterium]
MQHTRLVQDPELLRRLLRARDRIDAAPEESWPVRRLARVSGVSEAHFARSFRDAFGTPPHRYLLTRRLALAVALLRETDLSVTDVAFASGWSSLGTFSRTFRDVVGDSPSAVRLRERAARDTRAVVPYCFSMAANRPALKIAVLEKRRRAARGSRSLTEQDASPDR